jgi:hypothetical protein
LLTSSLIVDLMLIDRSPVDPYFRGSVASVTLCTELLSRKDNFITVLEILAILLASPNSPFKDNWLYYRDCIEIMGFCFWVSWD